MRILRTNTTMDFRVLTSNCTFSINPIILERIRFYSSSSDDDNMSSNSDESMFPDNEEDVRMETESRGSTPEPSTRLQQAEQVVEHVENIRYYKEVNKILLSLDETADRLEKNEPLTDQERNQLNTLRNRAFDEYDEDQSLRTNLIREVGDNRQRITELEGMVSEIIGRDFAYPSSDEENNSDNDSDNGQGNDENSNNDQGNGENSNNNQGNDNNENSNNNDENSNNDSNNTSQNDENSPLASHNLPTENHSEDSSNELPTGSNTQAEKQGSLVEDYADTSTEMPSYMDGDD